MAKDILLYGRIDEWNLREFFKAITESQEDDELGELTFRINTGGGEPEYGWGAAAKINETVNKKVKVDGKAYSWGTFACVYAEDVECLDVSQFMIHRAAYSEWFESSEYFTEPLQENLAAINKKLETAFRNRVNVEAFENLKQCKEKGITVKDIFSMEGRIDVFFSAADAKKIGLVKNVIQLTPAKRTEIENFQSAVKTARKKTGIYDRVEEPVETKTDEPKTDTIMDLKELKEKHPALYAQIVAEGKSQATTEAVNAAVEAERERIAAWREFEETDPVGVKAGVESGKPITMSQIAKYTKAMVAKQTLSKIEKDSAGDVKTDADKGEAAKTEKEKTTLAFAAEVDASLGLKKA